MDWNHAYHQDNQPTFDEITDFINSSLWNDINDFLQSNYKTQPTLSYSKCSAQPGWNVKYKKSGRSLCTLYPMDGFYIALVVIGDKETQAAEFLLPTLTPYLQDLYHKTMFACGGRWLMVEVTDKAILNDVIELIKLRVKPKV